MTTTELLPRKYQEEIFLQAQQCNVIAALDTGSGKTFISTLLFKWIAAKNVGRAKMMMFVPKVPLVEQQGDFIAKHSSLRVLKLHGASNINTSDRKRWQNQFEQYDVFVMTAQIFLNFLTHSLIKIQEVSLMVFDECHHARKNHPYAIIMKEYSQCPVDKRPKIFGMTASPIWNSKNPLASLQLLEATLDAKVIGVREHVEELSGNIPKPTEIMKLFPPPLEDYEDYGYPSPSLWMALSVFELLRDVQVEDSPWKDIERRYHVTYYNLGPYAASLYLFTETCHLITRLFTMYRNAEETENDLAVPSTSPQEIPAELFDIADILVDFQPYFAHIDDPLLTPMKLSLDWCTPKVRTLIEVLRGHISPTFQGIIFVEQRQIASTLSKILPLIPELAGFMKCGILVGNSNGAPKEIGSDSQAQVVSAFRKREINLIIATSVAEEGLDFPACDVVVRFDSLEHHVAYVQSRGRARNKSSNFIVMIQQDDHVNQERYQKLIATEPTLKEAYQVQLNDHIPQPDDDDGDEEESFADLTSRERYIVPSTSAFVTYDNAISLIGHLCSLIPHDLYTAPLLPVFTYANGFQCTLSLPGSLPLSPGDLIYVGPVKRTKKEAKRAVSFLAVKRLHGLDVFDNYLLPAGSRGTDFEDVEGKPIPDMSFIPAMICCQVRDPWIITQQLFMHPVVVDGKIRAGLVTGTRLAPVKIKYHGSLVETQAGRLLKFSGDEEMERLRLMENYTARGIQIRISASPSAGRPSLFLVPLTLHTTVDFYAIEQLVSNPLGHSDWSAVKSEHYGRLLVLNVNQPGRIWLLSGVRDDLTPMSIMSDAPTEEPLTYREYYMHKWTRKKWTARVPEAGPMLDLTKLSRSNDTNYALSMENHPVAGEPCPNGTLIPQGCCTWLSMSHDMVLAFGILPSLVHRITDIYRVRTAKFELNLPPILDNLMVQALTIPSALAGYNNQRLETLGDAVLELCTTVHLLNRFPYRHEGQLDIIRQRSVCNRFLLYRALDVGLDRFITSENHKIKAWRQVVDEKSDEVMPRWYASRSYPRRSLQDCMEATLGAAFVTGGIPMALRAGVALGLMFGGPTPWPVRYDPVEPNGVSNMFETLQQQLGYTFCNGRLLREALTHPSFASAVEMIPSYQRLEFLGDAILNLVVVHYLYNKYPGAASEQLALPRTKAVCAQALAYLAVRKLELHRVVLINNFDLSRAIDSYVPHLQEASPQTIINTGWKFDPPKVLSDVFESIVGAVLIDSGYNYEKTAGIVEGVMEDILDILSPAVRLDPISTLVQWIAAFKCQEKAKFSVASKGGQDGMQVILHDVIIAGPIISASMTVAKNLAAERALSILQDADQVHCLSRVCTCGIRSVSKMESLREDSDDNEEP
ncbi:hypothetical protein BDP27DRAFT_1266587, partial [Rhodocollybia butyracea]